MRRRSAVVVLLVLACAGCPPTARTRYPAPFPLQLAANAPLTSTTYAVAFAPGFSSRVYRADAPEATFSALSPPGDDALGVTVEPERPDALHVVTRGASSQETFVARSDDRGLTWTRATTGLPAAAEAGRWPLLIHADGGLAGRVWLGFDLADAPPGRQALFRSLDRGQTWTALAYPAPRASRVAVDAVDPARVRVLSRDGVFLSADGGQTFARDETGLPGPPAPSDLCADAGVAGRAWCVTDGGLYRIDAGAGGWVELPAARAVRGRDGFQASPTKVAALGDRVLLGVHRHGVFVSEDAGRSFTSPTGGLPSSLDFDLTPGAILIDATLPTRVVLATRVGLFQSDDGGRTWRSLPGTGLPLVR